MTPHAESRKVSPFFYPLRSEMNPSNHHQGITDWMYCICTYLILSVLVTSARRFRLLSQGPSGDCTHSELLNQQEGIIKM